MRLIASFFSVLFICGLASAQTTSTSSTTTTTTTAFTAPAPVVSGPVAVVQPEPFAPRIMFVPSFNSFATGGCPYGGCGRAVPVPVPVPVSGGNNIAINTRSGLFGRNQTSVAIQGGGFAGNNIAINNGRRR